MTGQVRRVVLPQRSRLTRVSRLSVTKFVRSTSRINNSCCSILHRGKGVGVNVNSIAKRKLRDNLIVLVARATIHALRARGRASPIGFFSALGHALRDGVRQVGSAGGLALVLLSCRTNRLGLDKRRRSIVIIQSRNRVRRVSAFSLNFPLTLRSSVHPFVGRIRVGLRPNSMIILCASNVARTIGIQEQRCNLRHLRRVIRRRLGRSTTSVQRTIVTSVRGCVNSRPLHSSLALMILGRGWSSLLECFQ